MSPTSKARYFTSTLKQNQNNPLTLSSSTPKAVRIFLSHVVKMHCAGLMMFVFSSLNPKALFISAIRRLLRCRCNFLSQETYTCQRQKSFHQWHVVCISQLRLSPQRACAFLLPTPQFHPKTKSIRDFPYFLVSTSSLTHHDTHRQPSKCSLDPNHIFPMLSLHSN